MKIISESPCETENGGCSHDCLDRGDGQAVCSCPCGYFLDVDKVSGCPSGSTLDSQTHFQSRSSTKCKSGWTFTFTI